MLMHIFRIVILKWMTSTPLIFNRRIYFKYLMAVTLVYLTEYDLSAQQLSKAEPKIDNRPTLFPNPTNSMLSLNSNKNYKIQVFDLNGRKLMEQNGNTLNMEHLSNATYVVKAMDVDTKEMLSYKVVKELIVHVIHKPY